MSLSRVWRVGKLALFVQSGWWFGVGIAADRTGLNVWLPFVSVGVDW